MALRNCISCGVLFHAMHQGVRLCPKCEKDEQARFDSVKAFIKENPGATALKIIQETGVERKELYDWVRSGRIEVAGLDGLGFTCESCGAAITSGRLCAECGLRMRQEANQLLGREGAGPGLPSGRKGGFHVRNSVLKRRERD